MQPYDPWAFTRDMREAGFDPAVDDPEFVRTTRVLPFVHRNTAMPLDVVLAGSGLERRSQRSGLRRRSRLTVCPSSILNAVAPRRSCCWNSGEY